MWKKYYSMKQFFRGLRRDERGSLLIESAILLSILSLGAVVTYDVSRAAYEQARLENVVRAGAQYGLRGQTEANDIDGIIAAAQVAAGKAAPDITITAATACECPGGTPIACHESCSDDNAAQMVMTITATRNLPVVLGWPGFTDSHSLRAETVVRAR